MLKPEGSIAAALRNVGLALDWLDRTERNAAPGAAEERVFLQPEQIHRCLAADVAAAGHERPGDRLDLVVDRGPAFRPGRHRHEATAEHRRIVSQRIQPAGVVGDDHEAEVADRIGQRRTSTQDVVVEPHRIDAETIAIIVGILDRHRAGDHEHRTLEVLLVEDAEAAVDHQHIVRRPVHLVEAENVVGVCCNGEGGGAYHCQCCYREQ